MKVQVALLCVGAGAFTPSTRLRALFAPTADSVLVDPSSKQSLEVSTRFVGDRITRRYTSDGVEYAERAGGAFVDLFMPKTTPTAADIFEELQNTLLRRTRAERVQTDTFRSPLVSFLYERGWRDSFKRSGFPGIEKEFEEVAEFFAPVGLAARAADRAADAGPVVIVDMSCGSGLMARRLAGAVARVAAPERAETRLIAADFSEAMLLECRRRFLESEAAEAGIALELVRVDVAQLPFATQSLDAVHAGAALHCWPRLEMGLSEVSRSLKPGGRFFATTFLRGALGSSRKSGGGPVSDMTGGTPGFRFFELEELERLMADAGFTDVDVRREGEFCAVIKCAAPLDPTVA